MGFGYGIFELSCNLQWPDLFVSCFWPFLRFFLPDFWVVFGGSPAIKRTEKKGRRMVFFSFY